MLAQDLAGPEIPQPKSKSKPTAKTPAPVAEEEADDTEQADAEPEEEEETPATDEEDEAAETNEEETETPAEEETDDENDDAPEGLKGVPKGVVKRLKNQSARIRELTAQLAEQGIQITPTAASPLADVENLEALDHRMAQARIVRDWCRANPEGGSVTLANGAVMEISPEQAAGKLARAESELDAAPDAKARLMTRAAAKPWEQAEVICPNLFKKGSAENTFMLQALQKCPEIKSKLDNWEMFLAAATRGITEAAEESQGKARYVRMALDPKGNLIAPKSVKTAPGAAAQAAPKTRPATPGTAKPALKGPSSKPTVNFDELEARAMAGDESARRELMKAEMAVA